MNREILKALVCERFGDSVRITGLDRKADRLPLPNDDGCTWRDYLIDSFGLRLEQAGKKDVDPEILKETETFIEALNLLPEDAVLYLWKAESDEHRYFGWASEDRLIYAHKR